MGKLDRGRLSAVTTLLTVDAVVAGYRDPVVGPISLTVDEREIVGLAGPNGSGKTTLLGAVVGTSRVFSGRVRRHPGLRVAVQAQRLARLPEMPLTGADLLHATDAHRHPVPDAIAPLLALRLDRLSGGQYQLLHVWACLASPAQLVLLDEPTNNMDPQAVSTLTQLMVTGREQGRGAIVVSHDHQFLENVCTALVEVGS
jgi:ATPase subunit of ABC transporter with duplicated ATPase domains